jgi:hypothetical protein
MWAALLPTIMSLLQKKHEDSSPSPQLKGDNAFPGAPGGQPPAPQQTQQSQGMYDPSKMEALKGLGGDKNWMDSITSASGY